MYQLWDTNIFVGIANGQIVGKPKLNLPVAVCPGTVAELFVGEKSTESRRIDALQAVRKHAGLFLPNVKTHILYLFQKISKEAVDLEIGGLEMAVADIARNRSFEKWEDVVTDFRARKSKSEEILKSRTKSSKDALIDAHKVLGGKRRHVAKNLLSSPQSTFPPLFKLKCIVEGREIGEDEPISKKELRDLYDTFAFYLQMYQRYIEAEGVERAHVEDVDGNDTFDLAQLLYIQTGFGVRWVTNDKKWKTYAADLGVSDAVLSSAEAFEKSDTPDA